MAKFKVGDRIIGNRDANIYGMTNQGWKGVVIKNEDNEEYGGLILVSSKEASGIRHWVNPVYFDLLEPEKSNAPSRPDDRSKRTGDKPYKRRVIIEITDDGATAEYIVGKDHKKGVSIKRYYKDTPDDYRAGIYAVAKLFDRKVAINDGDFFSLTEREVRDLEDSLKNAQGYLDDAKAIVKRNAVRK